MTRDKKFLLGEFAFIVGIILFPFCKIDLWILFLLAGLAVSFIFSFSNEKNKISCLVVLCLIAGIARFAIFEKGRPNEGELQSLNNQKVRLECEIVGYPEMKNGGQQIVLEVKDKEIFNGHILVFTSAYGEYSFGDTVNFEGALKIPKSFEDFDYRKYLRGKNIYLISYYPQLKKIDSDRGFYGAIYDFRKRADRKINMTLPSPESNIVSAMTIGMNSMEIKEVMKNFNRTGTSHIIVVSGSHMVVVVAILMFILLGIGVNRGKAFYLATFGIFCFVILSGSAASAVRAGIMAFVFLLAVKVGRGGDALRALIFSAVVMIFINPYILTGDVGFQLSFLATFGLIAILPVLQKKFQKWPEWGGIKDMFLITLAAQIAVFPILITNFGQFSLLSFLANILILPTAPLLMVGGFILIFVSFLNMFLAKVIAFPLYLLAHYAIAVADFLSRTDWGMIKF
jgi:competence protein ComEC